MLSHFQRHWPRYRPWYFNEALGQRPDARACHDKLAAFMPELLPTFQNLLRLLPGDKKSLTQFLSLYTPPPFMTGCSQAVWDRAGKTALIRNYDYGLNWFEGSVALTNWNRPVLALTDCVWGVLDGINDAGLAVSLAFGGDPRVGEGFAVTLILRYILECCNDVPQALLALARTPSHMSYNITMVDAGRNRATAFIGPLREMAVSLLPIATNHQEKTTWRPYAEATGTVNRRLFLEHRLEDRGETYESLLQHFAEAPLYNREYDRGFGTLYTSVYDPIQRDLTLIWPETSLNLSFDRFKETSFSIRLAKTST